MRLEKLLNNVNYDIIQGNLNVDIETINYDSSKIKSGDLFICIKGLKADGHNFANKAVANGAIVVICEDVIQLDKPDIVLIKVKDTRKALAIISANFYGNPNKKLKVVGITGTNGKTTTAFMIKAILEKAGFKVGLIGTIANYKGNQVIDATRTTPESLELQGLFNDMVSAGIEYCVMEVSSHSLALDRVYGVKFEVGIFTNLTRDHLDFHKTFENYYGAKYKLFQRSGIRVINIDDNYGKKIVKDLKKENAEKIFTYSIKENSNYRGYEDELQSRYSTFKLSIYKEEEFEVALPGEYNIYNAIGAIIASIKLGIPIQKIKEGLKNVVVTGRCERIAINHNLPYDIVIDYAHTPDGLQNILESARTFTKGRLITVFGCGGDRDTEKRPEMGTIGTELSDVAIITSDNPRGEEPYTIISDILKGVTKCNYIAIENRQLAIKRAIELATAGDVIVIAGKGHETYQILKDKKVHFDEREVVEEILNNMR